MAASPLYPFPLSPLAQAVTDRQTDTVRELLKAGPDLRQRVFYLGGGGDDPPWATLVHLCIGSANDCFRVAWGPTRACLDVLDLLVSAGADVNAPDSNGYTPIFWVARSGGEQAALPLLERLLAHGADVDARAGGAGEGDGAGAAGAGGGAAAGTALDGVVDQEELNRVWRGEIPALRGDTPLLAFARTACPARLHLAYEECRPPPHVLPCVRVLVDNGADVSAVNPADGLTPLLLVARCGLIDVGRVLVEAGGGHLDAVDRSTGQTALHYFCERFSFEGEDGEGAPLVQLCRQMIERCPQLVQARDGRGRTPLHGCAGCGHLGVARLLLERGASADVVDAHGDSPLVHAIGRFLPYGVSTARLMLKASSDETVRAKGSSGKNALEAAVDSLWDYTTVSTAEVLEWRNRDPAICEWYKGEPQLDFLADLVLLGLPVRTTTDEGNPFFVDNRARLLLPLMRTHVLPRLDMRESQLAAMRSESRRWRAHDDLVQLAFDARDAREAEERVRAKEARVRELEEELKRREESVEDEEEKKHEDGDGNDEGGGGGTPKE